MRISNLASRSADFSHGNLAIAHKLTPALLIFGLRTSLLTQGSSRSHAYHEPRGRPADLGLAIVPEAIPNLDFYCLKL
jgi:hypothetical protein